MRNLLISNIEKAIILCIVIVFSSICSASTIRALSCSYADVSAAIETAADGDTVKVPPGTCRWSTNLNITKFINLIGAGRDQTVIISDYLAYKPGSTFVPKNFLVTFIPSNIETNGFFRISGFTFDMNNKCGGIWLGNDSTTAITHVRIDHCYIKNAENPNGSMRGILVKGTVYGVIDSNIFYNNRKQIDSYGLNADSWNNIVFTFGTSDSIYYEDNLFYLTRYTPHSGGAGSHYCARFNTYSDSGSVGLVPWFDMHGNQNTGGNNSTMGAEIYGNTLFYTNGDHSVGIFDQRGGKAMIFNNTAFTSQNVAEKAREEYDDSLVPPAVSPITGQPQHVSDSYYWNNTKNGTIQVTAREAEDCCDAIAENSEYFNYNASFDGTVGIGVGPLSSRPDT